MKRLLLATAMLCAVGATPASAEGYRTYRCSNSTVLRVLFNEERGTATVVPFGRPSIRLERTEGDNANFRYARRDSHELRGNLQEVQWRAGAAEWTCRH
ncbi:MAG: hypothetical protein ABL871_07405 [Terricaulis sp.]